MHLAELEFLIEHEVRDVVQSHFPLDWKEDVITHEVLVRIRQHCQNTILHGLRYPLSIDWELYKLHGRRESRYGDIGVLVRYRLPLGDMIEGAGFLEAKVRGRETTKFLQLRHEQVNRLLSQSPQTQLLLYDYNPVVVLDNANASTEDFAILPYQFFHRRSPASQVSHAVTLPLRLAAVTSQYDDTLYRFSHSFSHQICRRYLSLHDLDFSETAVNAVKGFPTEIGGTNYVLVIRAATIGQELPEEFRPNDNVYDIVK